MIRVRGNDGRWREFRTPTAAARFMEAEALRLAATDHANFMPVRLIP